MENAQLLIEGLETKSIKKEERDGRYVHFCRLVAFFHETEVCLVKEEGLDTHNFSFGTVYDLLYGSWADFSKKDSLEGITQNSYQMVAPLLMQHPSLGTEIAASEWLKRGEPKASYGLCPGVMSEVYVTDTLTWQNARAKYYATHQTMYVWKEDDDSFLPNRLLSDKILEREIEKHGYMEAYEIEKSKESLESDSLSVVFHEQVMKRKGETLEAYTAEIGQQICEANYYQYEAELTRKEQKKVNSLRRIYSLINRNGEKQYISLDFRHGMMEFHDAHGKHLGEFRFTGVQNAEEDSSHNLQTL